MSETPATECDTAEEEEVVYCTGETRRATAESPAEFCEEEALPGSDLCYWCDPDGAAFDAAEARAEALREERLYGNAY